MRDQANDRRDGVNFSWGATRRSSPIPRRPRAFPRARRSEANDRGLPARPRRGWNCPALPFCEHAETPSRPGRLCTVCLGEPKRSIASANGEPLSPFRMFWRASKKYRGRLSEKSATD